MTVPAIQQFTPTGVQLFSLIDPDAQNASFNSIAAAFTAQSLNMAIATTTQLTATLRNVLVNLTGIGGIVITLPTNPSVGDPPCIVQASSTDTFTPSFAIINTSDGNAINGMTDPAGTFQIQPAVYTAGDSIAFTFIGGDVGWLAIAILSTTIVNVDIGAGEGGYPWMGQTLLANVPIATLYADALQRIGAWARVINISGVPIPLGDSTSTFNGVPGPYSIPDSVQATFTNVGTMAFTVTV